MDKQYMTIRGDVRNVDKDAGTAEALIPMSTGSVDRMEDIIEPSAYKKTLKQFMKHPVFVSSHDYWDLRKQIGHFVSLQVDEGGLMGMPKWYVGMGNDEADWGYKLATMNMAAFSVGFVPLKWEKIDKDKDDYFGNRRFTEVELLEISQVIVPANRDAIQGMKAKAAKDPVVLQLVDDLVTNKIWTVPDLSDVATGKALPVAEPSDADLVITADAEPEAEKAVTEDLDLVASGDAVPERKELSQDELADEVSYLSVMVAKVGVRQEGMPAVWDLVRQLLLKTPTGRDIPDDIVQLAGAVLSGKNKADIQQASDLLATVLQRSEMADEGDDEEKQLDITITESMAPDDIMAAVREVLAENQQLKDQQSADLQADIRATVTEVLNDMRGIVK